MFNYILTLIVSFINKQYRGIFETGWKIISRSSIYNDNELQASIQLQVQWELSLFLSYSVYYYLMAGMFIFLLLIEFTLQSQYTKSFIMSTCGALAVVTILHILYHNRTISKLSKINNKIDLYIKQNNELRIKN